GGGDPLFEDLAPQQGVDEGALAGVELAGDDEQEQLVELLGRPREGRPGLGRGVDPRQRLPQVAEQPAVLGQQLVLILIENAPQHGGCLSGGTLARETGRPAPPGRERPGYISKEKPGEPGSGREFR